MGVKGNRLGLLAVSQNFPAWINGLKASAGAAQTHGRIRKYSRFVPVENLVDIRPRKARQSGPRSGSGRGKRCQTACKPGSVRARHIATAGARRPFLWDAPRGAPRATNPGDGAGMPLRQPGGSLHPASPVAPIRSCSRWGLPCRPCCQGRGALLPHRFTLAGGGRALAPADCSLWHFPWGRPRRPLAGTVFPWSPDFPPTHEARACARRLGVSGRPAVWRG